MLQPTNFSSRQCTSKDRRCASTHVFSIVELSGDSRESALSKYLTSQLLTCILIFNEPIAAGIEAAQAIPERGAGGAPRIDANDGSGAAASRGRDRAARHHAAAIQRLAHPPRRRKRRRADA